MRSLRMRSSEIRLAVRLATAPPSKVTDNNSVSPSITFPPVDAANPAVVTLIGAEYTVDEDNIDATGIGSDVVFGYISVDVFNSTPLIDPIAIPYVFHVVITDYANFDSAGALGSVTFDIEGREVDRYVVFGHVVGVYIDDRFIKDGRLDTAAMRPIARLGYNEYAVVDSVFKMARPPGGGG